MSSEMTATTPAPASSSRRCVRARAASRGDVDRVAVVATGVRDDLVVGVWHGDRVADAEPGDGGGSCMRSPCARDRTAWISRGRRIVGRRASHHAVLRPILRSEDGGRRRWAGSSVPCPRSRFATAHGRELVEGCALLARSLEFSERDAVPPWLVQTTAGSAGLALGAFEQDRLIGFSFALPAGPKALFSCGLAVGARRAGPRRRAAAEAQAARACARRRRDVDPLDGRSALRSGARPLPRLACTRG